MKPPRVKAVCSVPRLGYNGHFGAIFESLGKFNLLPCWFTGAFWEKCFETALEDCLFGGPKHPDDKRPSWDEQIKKELQCDIILCLDYDTVCVADDVGLILGTIQERTDIDALASFQPRRGTGDPLCGIKGFDGGEMSALGPFKVDHAAFGLTALRASSLVSLPKPWFIAQVGARGPSYREEYRDPDMYFWDKWGENGKTAYVHPACTIGHIEEMVSFFDDVQMPSLTEQVAAKRDELCALIKQFDESTEEQRNEKRLVLNQKFMRTQDWRMKYLRNSGRDLSEKEERPS